MENDQAKNLTSGDDAAPAKLDNKANDPSRRGFASTIASAGIATLGVLGLTGSANATEEPKSSDSSPAGNVKGRIVQQIRKDIAAPQNPSFNFTKVGGAFNKL